MAFDSPPSAGSTSEDNGDLVMQDAAPGAPDQGIYLSYAVGKIAYFEKKAEWCKIMAGSVGGRWKTLLTRISRLSQTG